MIDSDLISRRDAEIALLNKGQASKRYSLGETWELNFNEIRETFDALKPTTELVRCKDCKHGEKSPTFRCYPNLTWCNKYGRLHDDVWFCADGELSEQNVTI